MSEEMNEGKMIDEFDIDKELQSIADKITEYGLNYGGALFEHNETGEEFVITVTKANHMHDKAERVEELTEQVRQLRELNREFAEFTKRQGWQHVLIDEHYRLSEATK